MDKSAIDGLERLSERYWRLFVLSMPIPCVDIIVEKQSRILMGFRAIDPYKNFWALPGGRILKQEHPEDTVKRVLTGINITARIRSLVGIFPMRFPRHPLKRYDITLCYGSEWVVGEPRPDSELVRFGWFPSRRLPARIGGNYRKMIEKAFSRRNT